MRDRKHAPKTMNDEILCIWVLCPKNKNGRWQNFALLRRLIWRGDAGPKVTLSEALICIRIERPKKKIAAGSIFYCSLG